MEPSRSILCAIKIPTVDLKVDIIQEILVLAKNYSKYNLSKEFWKEIAEILWNHLEECLDKFDDQLLCATCFYSVIILAEEQDKYLEKLLFIFGPEVSSPSHSIRECLPGSKRLPYRIKGLTPNLIEREQATNTLRIVSLIYGMFQSSFLIQIDISNNRKVAAVLTEIFDLLILMGYEYSEYTFLVFKIIKSFKKVCGGSLEKYIFNIKNNVKLLALVNNNWENPVTGVRDMNRAIFQIIISTIDNKTYQSLLQDLDDFYWNKAKFLMLSEIIDHHKGNIISLFNQKWIDGLIYSLHKPGLVSAGADMYYALLKNIDTQDVWCEFFLCNILNILNGTSNKAIENFTNYWCLTTMKKFKTIADILIDELEKLYASEQILLSKLCVMKQANKLGILDKNWNTTPNGSPIEYTVLTGIAHYNNHIRILAFDIICVSQGKYIPGVLEYNLILDYLQNNVNSDNTVLRLSMFNSFNYFLSQLHSTFVNVILKTENIKAINDLLCFCQKLQDLIKNNINLNGNYQRKITSVKLCNSVLTYFSDIPKKKKDQTRKADITLTDFLKKEEYWVLSTEEFVNSLIHLLKDPADDIRDNIIKILLSYYVEELQNVTLFSYLIDDAKKCMQSKFFYEISCGQSMFKLITNLLIRNKVTFEAEYTTVEDIFNFALNELITEHESQTNVMNSIERGKQLHSFMSILLVVLEQCILNSYKLEITYSQMSKLLHVLQNVSNHFAWEEEGSSDFAKMNDMVQNIIVASDYNPVDADDQTKITGLQQIVLNCLWLNVKASCDLASILIQYNENNINFCKTCFFIITRVLETSRHKGAIEAAGAALGRGFLYLTSLPEKDKNISDDDTKKSLDENDISTLPYTLLRTKLNDLIYETNMTSSITRRGAGLSIMVHRIVSNDMKKGKPLFHYFIKTLLQICNNSVDTEKPMVAGQPSHNDLTHDSIGNQLDLPKAIYIHFLTRIVTDSSLATDIMYYSVELAELAFVNLTSSHWQIRNAALQLYGALIPRLIGQKKASGTDEETIATVACDEMRTHLPKIWTYITTQLKQNTDGHSLQTHSNLVPILNMLANSAKRYNFSLHSTESESEFKDLFNHLFFLLNSPIYTVRRLTAKAVFNLYDFEYITNGILEQGQITENLLHGILLLVNFCSNFYYSNSNFKNRFHELGEQFKNILSIGNHSYLSKKLYEDIFVVNIDTKDIGNTMQELYCNGSPGVQMWAEARLKKYISKCSWKDIPNVLNIILQHDYENYCEMILSKIQAEVNIPKDVLLEVANILLTFEKRYSSCIVWKILYEISKIENLNKCLDVDQLLKNLEGKLSYNLRFLIPLIARNIGDATDESKSSIVNLVNNLTDFENSDVDMRYIAAVANNELANNFNRLQDNLKIISIKCAILLLQDEDEDIRNKIVVFYSILSKENRILQPYICLNKILHKDFLYKVFDEPKSSIIELCKYLKGILNLNHDIDEYNPFANDSKNIYFESHVFKIIIDSLT